MNAPQDPQAPHFLMIFPVFPKKPRNTSANSGNPDLNRRVHSGQPLDYAQVKNAKASAEALKGIHGKVVFTYV